jgi:aspartokinase
MDPKKRSGQKKKHYQKAMKNQKAVKDQREVTAMCPTSSVSLRLPGWRTSPVFEERPRSRAWILSCGSRLSDILLAEIMYEQAAELPGREYDRQDSFTASCNKWHLRVWIEIEYLM